MFVGAKPEKREWDRAEAEWDRAGSARGDFLAWLARKAKSVFCVVDVWLPENGGQTMGGWRLLGEMLLECPLGDP